MQLFFLNKVHLICCPGLDLRAMKIKKKTVPAKRNVKSTSARTLCFRIKAPLHWLQNTISRGTVSVLAAYTFIVIKGCFRDGFTQQSEARQRQKTQSVNSHCKPLTVLRTVHLRERDAYLFIRVHVLICAPPPPLFTRFARWWGELDSFKLSIVIKLFREIRSWFLVMTCFIREMF